MYHPDKYPVPENRVVGVTLWGALFLAIVFLLIGLSARQSHALRNDGAFIRVLAYIDANNVTKAQIMAASDASILAIMWPDTSGVKPATEHATSELVKRALKHVYRERLQAQRMLDIETHIEATMGIEVESVQSFGECEYLIRLGPDE